MKLPRAHLRKEYPMPQEYLYQIIINLNIVAQLILSAFSSVFPYSAEGVSR